MKNAFLHCWHAIRYGEWSCGWELYKGKPMFGFYTLYYDGDHAALHIGPLWIEVDY